MASGNVIPFDNYTSTPFHSNSSRITLSDLTRLNNATILSISTYSILLFFGLLGNLVVFLTLLKSRYRKSSRVNKLILHLAVADLLVCCFTIPIEIGWRVTGVWQAGDVGCRILQFTRPFGLYLSSNTIICISLDRYFAIVQPLKLADARRRGRFMLACAWIFAVICSIPQAVIFQEVVTQPFEKVQWIDCVSVLSTDIYKENHSAADAAYNILSIYAMYFLPLGITLFAYGRILWEISITRRLKATRQNAQSPTTGSAFLAAHPEENSEISGSNVQPSRTNYTLNRHVTVAAPSTAAAHSGNNRIRVGQPMGRQSDLSKIERARSRTLKLTILIVSLFIICFTPYAVMLFWYQIDRNSALLVDQTIQEALFIFAVSNSILNPYLYGIYSKSLRNEISRSIICQAFRHCFVRKNDYGGSSSDLSNRDGDCNKTTRRIPPQQPIAGEDPAVKSHLLPRKPVMTRRMTNSTMHGHIIGDPQSICEVCPKCAPRNTTRFEGGGNWSMYTAGTSSSQKSLVSDKLTGNCSLQRVTAAYKSNLCPQSNSTDLRSSSFD